jgi:hypothetical protein
MAASEAHIQGIARFLLGFGTEEDDRWRDYHFDFCGTIEYDPKTGAPVRVNPVENSGYSLGCLQLDFGQTTAAAEPFIIAFQSWHTATPGSVELASTTQFAISALKSDGRKLVANPASALHLQDVEALSAYALSPAGSDWVNNNIDNALIGSDAQPKSKYSSELTLIGAAREAEATEAFKKSNAAGRTDMTDLIYAMTMKAYNQAPGNCIGKLLPLSMLSAPPLLNGLSKSPPALTGLADKTPSKAITAAQLLHAIAASLPSRYAVSYRIITT